MRKGNILALLSVQFAFACSSGSSNGPAPSKAEQKAGNCMESFNTEHDNITGAQAA